MKMFSILLVLIMASVCYADRVCTEKTTGKLIEYQSDGDKQKDLDAMIKNAEEVGYKKEDIEAKFITQEEWALIREEQIVKPAREKAKAEEEKRKQKEDIVRQKLGLSEADWQDLKEVLDG